MDPLAEQLSEVSLPSRFVLALCPIFRSGQKGVQTVGAMTAALPLLEPREFLLERIDEFFEAAVRSHLKNGLAAS
jgi:hypothetical protein